MILATKPERVLAVSREVVSVNLVLHLVIFVVIFAMNNRDAFFENAVQLRTQISMLLDFLLANHCQHVSFYVFISVLTSIEIHRGTFTRFSIQFVEGELN